jgi:apolipoprotein N-acyltransferase
MGAFIAGFFFAAAQGFFFKNSFLTPSLRVLGLVVEYMQGVTVVTLVFVIMDRLSGQDIIRRAILYATCWPLWSFVLSYCVIENAPVGVVLSLSTLLMQTASLWSIYGVTILFVFWSLMPALFWYDQKKKAFVWGIFIPCFVLGYGYFRLSLENNEPQSPTLIRLLQTHIDLREESGIPKSIQELSLKNNNHIKYVVWPESTIPFIFIIPPENNRQTYQKYRDLMPEGGGLIFSTNLWEMKNTSSLNQEEYLHQDIKSMYNGTIALDKTGKVLGIYQKNYLFKWGERLPYRWFLSSVPGLNISVNPHNYTKLLPDYAKGTQRDLFSLPELPPYTPLICFESLLPGTITRPENEKSTWILLSSNDGWFKGTNFVWYLLHYARFQAVAEGKPILRSANFGFSAVINAVGRITKFLPIHEDGYIDTTIPSSLPPAVPSKYQNFMALFLILILITLSL